MLHRPLSILIAALAVAACQSDPYYATAPAPVAVAPAPPAAYPQPVTAGTSSTTTSSWTSPDGSQTVSQTRTRSASVSYDPSVPWLASGPVGMPAPFGPEAFIGKWQLTDGSQGRTCTIDLKRDQSFGMYAAWTSLCSTSDLFQVNRWQLRGTEIVLLDLSGAPKASLRPTGPNRYDGILLATGQPVTMWR